MDTTFALRSIKTAGFNWPANGKMLLDKDGTKEKYEVGNPLMDHKESAQELLEDMRIYHNYIRPHQALDGKTPAEASGIRLEGVNKWLSLMKNAAADK